MQHINNATYWSQVFIWGKDSHSFLLCVLLIHRREKTQQNKARVSIQKSVICLAFFCVCVFYFIFFEADASSWTSLSFTANAMCAKFTFLFSNDVQNPDGGQEQHLDAIAREKSE